MTKYEHPLSADQSVPLLLAGAGHAHLVAMQQWLTEGWRPPAGSVLVNPDTNAWYSGMMPGLIAGRFALDECAIPLIPVCQQLGIQLITADIKALDSGNRRVVLSNSTDLRYQHLSINTGSCPVAPVHVDGSMRVVPAKPFPEFIRQWQAWQQSPPVSLMVLGGGAAAFELAMAISLRFRQTAVSLVCSGHLLAALASGLRHRARRYLQQADIRLIEQCRIDALAAGSAWSEGEKILSPDAVVLATGASAQPWYRAAGFDCDAAGFICVNERLCASGDATVFVAGDAASAAGSQRSGVFSVRHGPVLAHNIPAALENRPLISYQPQTRTLALLATADGGALMSYASFALGGRLTAPMLGRWKDHLDISFMKRHRH